MALLPELPVLAGRQRRIYGAQRGASADQDNSQAMDADEGNVANDY